MDDITVASDSKELLLSSSGKTLRAKHVVSAPGQSRGCGELRAHISRGLFICSSPLGSGELNMGGGGVNLLRLLAPDGQREAILLQLSHFSGTCPEGLCKKCHC